MQGQTLMLDNCYQPIDIKPWQVAMKDWARGKIQIIASHTDHVIHKSRGLCRPLIAAFIEPTDANRRAIKFSRDNVYARDHGKCAYCTRRIPRSDITYDHVVPRAQGGKTWWTNVVISCVPCNQRKRNRTPEQSGMWLRCPEPAKPKSLPPRVDQRLLWRDGMPDEWAEFLSKDQRASRDYWHSELV